VTSVLPPFLRRWVALLGIWLAVSSPAGVVEPPRLRLVRTWSILDGLPDNCVKSILRTRDGRLWVGTRMGLARFDEQGMVVYTSTNAPALRNYDVGRLAEDAAGTVWIATPSGVVLYRSNRFERIDPAHYPEYSVNAFLPDTRSGHWVGTAGGLGRFQRGRWIAYDATRGMPYTDVNSLAEDGEGRIWVGCHRGLLRFSPTTDRFETVPLPPGISEAHIQAIRCEADGGCWVLGHVIPVPRHHLWRLAGGTWEDRTDGDTRVGDRLLVASSMQPGAFWDLSTDWGLETWIDPSTQELLTQPPSPREHVWSLLDDGVGNLWVGSGSYGLQLWRLPANDAAPAPFAWVGRSRVGSWASLAPAVAIGGGGALLVVVLGWSLHRSRVVRLRRDADEALVRQREGIARHLHDRLGSSLTHIALLAGQPAGSNHGAAAPSASGAELTRSAEDAAQALREVLGEMHPLDPSLDGFLGQLSDHAQSFVGAAGLRFRLHLPDDPPAGNLSPAIRRELSLATREALHNVVRHAAASEVRLIARVQDRQLELRIEDDGVGVGHARSHPASGGRGLPAMRQRLRDLGGDCTVAPHPDRGTCVRFLVPLDGAANN
jgi:signal transduction histidine kinase